MAKEQIFKVGDWVVKEKRPLRVKEVIGNRLIVADRSVFGEIAFPCFPEEVRFWTIGDVEHGQYLTCDAPNGNKVIYISKGKSDPFMAIAGCNSSKDMWLNVDCCRGYKECVRPADDKEICLLNNLLKELHMHWNLDRLELERIQESNVSVARIKHQPDDWALFRREAAKDILCALISARVGISFSDDRIGETPVKNAIFFADELIKQLKEKEG